TRVNRVRVLSLQTNEIDRGLAIGVSIKRCEKLVLFQRANDRIPLLLRVGVVRVLQVEKQLQIDIGNAGVVFRPLDVAAHPEKGISNARKHTNQRSVGVVDYWSNGRRRL